MSFFIVPIVGTGTRADPFVPKYIPALAVEWQWRDMPRNWGIVWANATPAQEATVGANADAIVVPPLDDTIALTATQNALEALNVPAQWLTSGMTYRTVLRVIVGMASFAERCDGMGLQLTLAGNLDKTLGQFSVQTRNILAAASDSLGLDRSSITGSTTVREVLRIMGQQFAAGTAITLGDL